MPVVKYSRQRESIHQFLKTRKDHPTADTVYMHIREEYPNISLGTVYRNLSLLTQLGEIQKITAGDGADRFDGNPKPHYHFICTECQCVLDMELDEMNNINEIAARNFDGSIAGHLLNFYGICGNCKKVEKNRRM